MISPWLSIRELRALLDRKEISAHEVQESYQARFAVHDGQVGSALELFEPASVRARSNEHGPLAAIPGLIKDNICIQGREMTCASKILKGYQAPYTATAVRKLEQAGAWCVGRANCDEFAMGSSTETSAYRTTRNPWNLKCSAGGSSGGSIAAVAAGLVPWALGSETGGSVRQPAALCGIVGSKPTYGLVSRYGLTAYASSLDQIGVATRTVYDNALVLSIIAGQENPIRDSTVRVQTNPVDFIAGLSGKIRPGLRIGILRSAIEAEGMDPEVRQAIEGAIAELQKLGAIVQAVEATTMQYAAATYFVISRAEAASNLARFDGIHYGVRSEKAQTLEESF